MQGVYVHCVVVFVPLVFHVSFFWYKGHILLNKKTHHCIQTSLTLTDRLLRMERNQDLTRGELSVWIKIKRGCESV